MSFAQLPIFNPQLYYSTEIPAPSDQASLTPEQITQCVQPAGRKTTKVCLLGEEVKIESFSSPSENQPLRFVARRANYDFTLALWANQALIEVRLRGENDLRGYHWARSAQDLQLTLQAILQDTTKSKTVGQKAGVELTQASWDVPVPLSTWRGPRVIDHSSRYTRQHGGWGTW